MRKAKESKEFTATITIRMSEPLKERIMIAAQADGVDASSYVRRLLAEALRLTERTARPVVVSNLTGQYGPICGCCGGIGIVEDPQHGHALKCPDCRGDGVAR